MVSYTIFKAEEPEKKVMKSCSIDAATLMTDIQETNCNSERLVVKLIILFMLKVMFVSTITVVGCFLISSSHIQEKLPGNVDGYPEKHVTIPKATTVDIEYFVPLIVILLFMVLLIFSYVLSFFIRNVRFQGNSELKKIVIHPNRSVIANNTNNPQQKKADTEKETGCATRKSHTENYQ